MRPMALVIVYGLVVGVSVPAGGQQSVAESTRPIGAEQGESSSLVIDNSSLVRAGAASRAPAAEAEPLLQATEACADTMRDVNLILAETGSGKVFFDPEWRQRMDDAAYEFARTRVDFELEPVEDRYLPAADAVVEALTSAADALAVVQNAIANDQPVFARAKKQLLTAEQLLDRAFAEMRAVRRAEDAEQPAPPIDPIAASRSIDELCGGRFGLESSGFADCVSDQRAAIDAMVSRNEYSVGLAEALFNTIRNNCRFEWPDDFVNRDRCEQRRIASKGGG